MNTNFCARRLCEFAAAWTSELFGYERGAFTGALSQPDRICITLYKSMDISHIMFGLMKIHRHGWKDYNN